MKAKLKVAIGKSEVDALKYVCALTDENLTIHESEPESEITDVTIECSSIEMLYAVIRSFDARLNYIKTLQV